MILRRRLDTKKKNKQTKKTNGKQNYHRILLLLGQQSIILFRLVLSTASSFIPKPTTRQYKDVYRPSYVPESCCHHASNLQEVLRSSRRNCETSDAIQAISEICMAQHNIFLVWDLLRTSSSVAGAILSDIIGPPLLPFPSNERIIGIYRKLRKRKSCPRLRVRH